MKNSDNNSLSPDPNEDVTTSKGQEKNFKDKSDLLPIEQIRGMLKPDGPMLTDEDVDKIRYEYLKEKYKL